MTTPDPNHRLRLASHVCACEVGGQVILLDLRANRYMGIDASAVAMLAGRVDNLPVPTCQAPQLSPRPSNERGAFAERLVSQGLLVAVTNNDGSASFRPTALDEATSSLDLSDAASHQSVNAGRFADFLRSTARAAWWLRTRSLYSIATTLSAGKNISGACDAGIAHRMKQCAATYERLRPLLLTANEKCLFDSLAMVGFLAAENLYPRWVIGVKTRPFGAHAWVQAGNTVLNDQHEYVRQFRPILAV